MHFFLFSMKTIKKYVQSETRLSSYLQMPFIINNDSELNVTYAVWALNPTALTVGCNL